MSIQNDKLMNLADGKVLYDDLRGRVETAVSTLNGAINANADAISDLQKGKAPIILDTASGAIASIPDGADGLPVEHLIVGIEPVQSGSGDPSPENVRPISGWTGCNVTIAPTTDPDDPDKVVKSVSWADEAGTVYGGTLDVTTGVLTVDKVGVDLGNATWSVKSTGDTHKSVYTALPYAYVGHPRSADNVFTAIAEKYVESGYYSGTNDSKVTNPDGQDIGILYYSNSSNKTPRTLFLIIDKNDSPSGILVYRIAEPQTYQLTPVEVSTLLGTNNLYADTGDVEVQYRADTALFIQKTEVSGVSDVQVNGTSVVTGGVANVPMADASNYGVVKIKNSNGVMVHPDNCIGISRASNNDIKSGNAGYNPIVPTTQHRAVFYGLATASGDTTQSSSSNAVGVYTPEALKSIRKMLGLEQDWELIADVTTTEDLAEVSVSTDLNGQPFELSEMSTRVSLPPTTTGTKDFVKGSTIYKTKAGVLITTGSLPSLSYASATSVAYFQYDHKIIDYFINMYARSGSSYNNTQNAQNCCFPDMGTNQSSAVASLNGITLKQYNATSTLIPSGTRIQIYGRRII